MKKINFNAGDFFRNLRLSAFEWVALVATVIFVGVVSFYYLNSTQPLRSKLSDLQAREKKLQSQQIDEKERRKLFEAQSANREKILDSLNSFESRLHNRKVGITAIIDEVNQLAKANRVTAGDIAFRTDAPAPLPGEPTLGASPGVSPSPAAITQRDKLPNIYEGLGIDTTIEGDYHDLRRFISALERSRNFVIINTISLQSIDETQREKSKILKAPNGAPQTPGAPQPQPPGSQMPTQPGALDGASGTPDSASPSKIIVSLKIEMETHFSREERIEPAATAVPAKAPAQKQ